ncbi:hypothetical protein SCFA_2600005 [anaerobic digester metagenome]|jgi:hypothetical protein|uniref:Uncharacterized protein n=1 Tax=anaerobic digester metagenome TaxID=1263854 RepID=A0A485M621_9ZZZZ
MFPIQENINCKRIKKGAVTKNRPVYCYVILDEAEKEEDYNYDNEEREEEI